MKPRKVGQDMVVKKKSASSAASSTARKTVLRSIAKPVVQASIPESTFAPKPRSTRRDDDEMFKQVFTPHHVNPNPARGGIMWVFVVGAIIALIVTVFSIITHATVKIDLQETVYPMNTTLTFFAEPAEGQIAFKTAKVVDRQSITVPTTNKQSGGTFATGTVKLFSSATKSTVIPSGTKLTSTAGKTFTTKSAVTIPVGTVKTPGSVEVAIVAAQTGEASNVGLDDFRLTSFPKVTARATTEIGGGSSGDKFVLTDAEMVAAKTSLQGLMNSSSTGAFLANQIPKNFILPQSLITISDPSYHTESTDSGVIVTADRTITGNMIDIESFKNYLLNQIVPETDRVFMQIYEIKDLSFSVASAQPATDTAQIQVAVTGSFVGRTGFDESVVRTKIAKQKKVGAVKILETMPGVISVEIRIWPPWIGRVPNKISAITFETSYRAATTGQNP